jgi:hypothetical protein
MTTIKLIVTIQNSLKEKYGQHGWQQIREALDKLFEADQARGIHTVLVCLDDESETQAYDISPVKGKVAPLKCKKVIDQICAKLSPDYLVLLGAHDVIPHFEVPNPSYQPVNGDDDEKVPTDNPYACSRPFNAKKRDSYLIPDRVVGRVPDLPGKANDLRWLLDGLQVAGSWKTNIVSAYSKDLMVCCDAWRKSGEAIVSYLSRSADALMIAPPTLYNNTSAPPILTDFYPHLFHVIKCHGAPIDTMFYGQKGKDYPPVMTSNSLSGKTLEGTVVGAMCCYGAALFDPKDPRVTAEESGDAPIPSVYLRQGAYGFVGSTTIAWVGDSSMLCADWIIASFMHYVMEGASTGRALLDAKQEFVRWINQQGRSPDIGEEKTLLQFHLLGDPSIHPVTVSGEVAALSESEGAATAVAASLAFERRRRRSFRRAMGNELRKTLPTRELVEHEHATPASAQTARDVALAELEGFRVDQPPLVHKVISTIPKSEVNIAGAVAAAAGFSGEVESANIAAEETFQYYWTARTGAEHIVDARMVKVETDRNGEVLRTQVLVTA